MGKKWHVKSSQTLIVGSKTFVKLPRSKSQFAILVFHGCKTLPNPRPKDFSLSASIGYNNLVDRRNTQQAQELQNTYVESLHVPDIFKDIVSSQDPPAKERPSRAKIKEGREAPETLMLPIYDDEEAPWALELVKPLNPRDELAVELDADVINKLIKYLQHAGFNYELQEVNKKRKGMSSDAPQGILNRKSRYTGSHIYLAKDQDGILRTCKTLDDAVMVLQGLKPYGDLEDEVPEASDAGDEEATDAGDEEASDAGDDH